MSNQAWFLFVSSAASFLMISSVKHFSSHVTPTKAAIRKEYQDLIAILFAYTPKPLRNVANDVTASRFSFFSGQYQKYPFYERTKVIHVAGTKGKGSTVEYIGSGLIGHTKRVGIFTSPHLHTARERIKIGRELISTIDFVHYGKSALAKMAKHPWTVFFDLLLCMAIDYFGDHRVDYLILETGIGGKYDSTNFLAAVDAAVITSISLDHQAILGNTVEEIALQKAGIIKKGCHVFTSAGQPPSVLQVFRDVSEQQGAMLHVVPVSKEVASTIDPSACYDAQIENICLSAAVLRHFGVSSEGMTNFYWPCRMERFHIRNLDVIVDGAHNQYSVELLLKGLRSVYPGRKLLVIFGAGSEKSVVDMVRTVQLYADDIVFVKSSHFKSMSEAELGALYGNVLVDLNAPSKLLALNDVPVPVIGASVGSALDRVVASAR